MGDVQPIQQVELEVSYGDDFPTFHCPRCGKQVLTPNGPDACSHLWYFYADAAGCFVHLSSGLDDIEISDEQCGDDDDEDDWDVTRLVREQVATLSKNPKGVVEFRVTHGGVACGPVWFTDVYCFDFLSAE